jgi:hypothetical protein
MNRAKRILAALAALVLAAALWLPCLHLFFARPASDFYVKEGLSPKARELAARQMRLWADPVSRRRELDRMRVSNAEWDFGGRCFLVWALANMGLRDPSSKPACLQTMDRIIDETLQLEQQNGIYFFLMPYARARPFVAQPARSLFLDGEIAMMLASRRFLEEKPEYKSALTARVNLIADGLRQSPGLALESYPDECWTYDHAVALAAIRMADYLDGSDHSALIRDWVAMAKQKLVHPASGLLVSSFTTQDAPLIGPEGSSLWMIAHCLQLLDEDFAGDQYDRARRELAGSTLGFSYAREWPDSWNGPADIDSGPIIPFFEISAGSSGLAFIGASAFGDDAFLASLNATLDFAGFPSRKNGALKYSASNQVGDAALFYAATLGPIWQKVKAGRTK